VAQDANLNKCQCPRYDVEQEPVHMRIAVLHLWSAVKSFACQRPRQTPRTILIMDGTTIGTHPNFKLSAHHKTPPATTSSLDEPSC
jgi:hypothetical protein